MKHLSDAPNQPHHTGLFQIKVTLNASLSSEGCQYKHRLFMMLHDPGGSPVAAHPLATALARGGFVVTQVVHDCDNFRDKRLARTASFRRPGFAARPCAAAHARIIASYSQRLHQ